ncbi:hypothetical protein [Clostridium peptidivorans]|uniref:hypothetical protein n=1 Tax=Clostridium peptidivorans TaxID=100174 RepID=UPI000BE3D019|nr:hypothetical protein [Clostridium peptidivorans]
MLKKNKLVELDSKCFYYKKDKENGESVIPLEQIKYVDIKRRNIYVLVKGEEVLIKKFTLPNVKDKYILEQMIEREIIYYFKDITNMCYSYSIYGGSKNTLEIMVFCLNCNGMSKIKDIAFKNNIKAVWIIQNTFLEYFHNHIIQREFIFICNYENNLYLVACKDDCIIATKTLRLSLNKMELNYILEDFLKECHEKDLLMNDINLYVANIETEHLKPLDKNYNCIDLGVIDKEEFKAHMERRLKV